MKAVARLQGRGWASRRRCSACDRKIDAAALTQFRRISLCPACILELRRDGVVVTIRGLPLPPISRPRTIDWPDRPRA